MEALQTMITQMLKQQEKQKTILGQNDIRARKTDIRRTRSTEQNVVRMTCEHW